MTSFSFKKLPRNIYLLGLLSFFNDLSADMISPLLPLYLASLGKGAVFLGWMEGGANFLSYATMLFSGWYTDRFGKSKSTTVLGYGFCALLRPLFAIPVAGLVFAVRLMDRLGKGIRTSPRDHLLTASVEKEQWGQAFGVQRAMDHMGALLAPPLAWLLLSCSISLSSIFLLASVPALLSIFLIPRRLQTPPETSPKTTSAFSWKLLPPAFKYYLILIFFSGLSTPSELFLILKMQEFGMQDVQAPWAWFLFTAFALVAAYGGGFLADHWGRRKTIALGWFLFVLSYWSLAFNSSLSLAWLLLALFGFQNGLVEAAERSYPASLVSSQHRASALGYYAFAYGSGLLPGSIFFGWVWKHWGSFTAFFSYGLITLFLLPALYFLPSSKKPEFH